MKPSTIRALADKGFNAEQIALIAEVEHQESEGRRAKDRERQARKREKDKEPVQTVTRSHAESRGQAVTERDTKPALSSSSLPLEENKESKKEKKEKKESAKRKTGTRLPDDWRPNESHYAAGLKIGIDRPGVDALAEDLRLWAHANEHRSVARKSDVRGWDMAFHAWMRRNRPKPANQGRGPPRVVQPSWHELEAELREKANGQATDNHTETEPLEGELFPPLRSVG